MTIRITDGLTIIAEYHVSKRRGRAWRQFRKLCAIYGVGNVALCDERGERV